MINWNQYYEQYKVNNELIWLNNCGTTPIGEYQKKIVFEFLEDYSRHGILTEVEKYLHLKKTITQIISKLINSEEDEIGIIHNTSEGMNLISHEINLSAGDEILLLENEYPSNVYPFEHWKNKSVQINFIPLADTPKKFLENFLNTISNQTKYVSLSLVHWCTGMPLPIEEIGKICKEKNINLIIDGAQGVGLVDVDVKKMNIGYMSFPAWKWLLGPLGLGIIYVSKKNLELKVPIFKGQNSVIQADEYLPYKSEWKKGADRYEYSTSSMSDWVYFKSSLLFLQEIGFDKVKKRIYELTNYLADRARKKGYEIELDKFKELNTGILSIKHPSIESNEIHLKLKANKVVSALRLGKIRLAPHIYILENQLEKVASLL
jgi:selenocysteine lyase/cysteine desulfurase